MIARRILRLLGTRYGMIVIIVVAVVIIVGVARFNTGPSDDTARHNQDEEQVGEEEHGHVDGFDDSQEELDEDLTQLPPEAVDVAVSFAKEWVNPDDAKKDAWFEAVSKQSTKNLQEQLKATDPQVVPADEIVGKPDAKGNYVEIETNAGLLTLLLIKEDGKWKVDGIDFENP